MTNAEIRKGEYARTIAGYISKVKEVTDDWIECESAITKHYEDTFDSLYPDEFDTITKHSFNLKDLIEVGDFINGWKVLDVLDEEDKTFLTTSGDGYISKIYSIVTKEQMEAIQYVV